MQITANELNAIKTIALGQASLAKLGDFVGKDDMIAHFKKAKKTWWAVVRTRYALPSTKGTKRLAIELDGDLSGQLRYKAKTADEKSDPSRRVVQTHQAQVTQGGQGQTQGNGSQEADCCKKADLDQATAAQLKAGLNEVFKHCGINLQVGTPVGSVG